MNVTCPSCGVDFAIEAGFLEGDGKRLAAILAGMDAAVGRATVVYLRLFKPPKTSLRLARAAAIAKEVADLVDAGSVARDERTGVRRPATPAMWAAGIEQMLAQRDSLELPLTGHGYLRAVVFGLADQADASAERQREVDARAGRREPAGPAPASADESKLQNELDYLGGLLKLDKISQAEYAKRAQAARDRHGPGA